MNMHRTKVALNQAQVADIVINLDLVRAIRPHASDPNRAFLEFGPNDAIVVDESFTSIWNKIQATASATGAGTIREHRASP